MENGVSLIRSMLTNLDIPSSFDKVISSYNTEIDADNRLIKLDMIGLALTEIPPNIFDKMFDLTHLYLSWNNITSLPNNIFDNLTKLNHLDLRGSGLRLIQPHLFDCLVSLQRIELNDNKLTSLPKEIFMELFSLREINLSNNQITELPPNIFDNQSGLERLYLYFNPLPNDIASGDYYDRESVLEATKKIKFSFAK